LVVSCNHVGDAEKDGYAGFGLCGVAETLIQAIQKRPELTGLKVVSNNAGIMHTGGLGRSVII
jgi:acyl CoA:acetate/3-ketoacid CoA transferase alpha subunit